MTEQAPAVEVQKEIQKENPEQGAHAGAPLLPLHSEGRVVCWKLRSSGRVIRHRFSPLSFEAAKRYWREARDPAAMVQAELSLWALLAAGIEGYPGIEGADWKQRLPEGDRRRAVQWLTRVDFSTKEIEFTPAGDVVTLDALWNENAAGEMHWYTGLEHVFRPRTPEDDAWLRDFLSRHLTVGGARRGSATRPPAWQIVYCHFYDRMIESVSGYGVQGHALTEKEEIANFMDPFHKFTAVLRWLAGEMDVEEPTKPGADAAAGEEDDEPE